MPTAKDIELLRLHNKKIRMRVRLLDSTTYTEVDNITGTIVSCSFDKDSGSDIRSTCSLTLHVPKKSSINADFDKTWNKRMVELFCGIYDNSSNRYVEYSLGRMLMSSGGTTYRGDTQEVRLNLVDLMASLTEERGSQIGTDTFIPTTAEGVNVRNVIVNIIGTFTEFKRHSICEFDSTLPHDLRFEVGVYPIEMLSKVLSLFPYYEMYYDEAGVFTVRKIPTQISDPIDIGADILDDLIISESRDSDFSQIRNTTEIWGRTLTCDYAAKKCETSGSTYNVTIGDTFTAMVDGESYAVKPTTNSVSGQKMKIQTLPEYKIYTMNGAGEYSELNADEMLAGTVYAIRYTNERFVLQGEMQIRCIVQEIVEEPPVDAKEAYMEENACWNVQWVVNPDSVYGCTLTPTTNRISGEIKQVLQDGEYAEIYTTQLAYERARYENWRKCRLQDTVEVEMIIVPWMKINQKIQYTSPVSGELGTWIVQAISYDFKTWTMTVRAARFYPYYPWEEE